MDKKTTVEALKEQVLAFRDARDWEQFHDPKNLAMGLGIEAAELQELFLWKKPEEVQALLEDKKGHEKVAHELADVFAYLLYLSHACGVDLSAALKEKLVLNAKKYPVEKCRGSHRKYTEL
jgi:NTP pyrophosphatase (non-canonical NTP hydrolase)